MGIEATVSFEKGGAHSIKVMQGDKEFPVAKVGGSPGNGKLGNKIGLINIDNKNINLSIAVHLKQVE